jgi:hypothetical protein
MVLVSNLYIPKGEGGTYMYKEKGDKETSVPTIFASNDGFIYISEFEIEK